MLSTTFTGARKRWAVVVSCLVALLGAVTLVAAPAARADVFWSAGTGSHTVHGAILDKYRAVSGPSGLLGYPTTDEIPLPGGAASHFQRGSIYWSPATGAHIVRGAIRDTWSSMGSETSYLGYPTTDELRTPNGLGAFNHFAGGSVYWSPATGAQVVRGAIRDKWASTGWEGGFLGFPTTSETPLAGGAASHFQGGSIYWSPATGAHIVQGAIRDAWAAMGSETSPLGFPISDEYAAGGGRRSDFQHGSIIWTPGLGSAVDLTLSGHGPQQIALPLSGAPQVAEVHAVLGGPNYALGSISVVHGNGVSQVLAESQDSQSTDLIAPINLQVVNGSAIRGFDVEAHGDWSIHLMPASSVPSFGPRQSVTSTYGTQVVHYTGPGGPLAMTWDYGPGVQFVTFAPDGSYRPAVALGPDGTGTVAADTYIEVISGARWTLTAG